MNYWIIIDRKIGEWPCVPFLYGQRGILLLVIGRLVRFKLLSAFPSVIGFTGAFLRLAVLNLLIGIWCTTELFYSISGG